MDESANETNETKDVRRDFHESSCDARDEAYSKLNIKVEVKHLETPSKRENDKNEYRAIELPNGLKALLIADSRTASMSEDGGIIASTTCDRIDGNNDANVRFKRLKTDKKKMAAFGLCIGVGTYNDPPEVPGMARFLEHMIVIGSKKYPQEYGFDSFVKGCDGCVDACTGSDQTTFKVTVPEKLLSDALDRFAQFFIEPLLKQSAVTRVRQSMFLRGNVTNEVLYDKVLRFRERYYRAHNMNLTIKAGLSLDTLEECVKKCFSSMPNNSLPLDYFAEFSATDLLDISGTGRVYAIKTITDDPKIEFIWRIPSIYLFHRSKPLQYISWLICHNGKGSLISYLREKGWCWSISTDIKKVHSNCSKFDAQCSLSLHLTDLGSDHRVDVETSVFSYINFIRKKGPQKQIYDEISKLEEAKLRFTDETATIDPFDICKTMSSTSPVDYVTGYDRYLEYDPESIKACVDLLVPANANIVDFCSEEFDKVCYSKVEPWFRMSYGFFVRDKKIIHFYGTVKPKAEFDLPKANPFVTDEFDIISAPENPPLYPIKIHSDAMCEIWHKLDTKFKLPKCYLNFHYISPLPLALPENAAMLDLFVTILKPLVLEEWYPATVAGFEYQLYSSDKGLIVEVHGFNQKITLLTTVMTRYIAQCSALVTEDLLAKAKEEQRATYYNNVLSIPEELAEETRQSILRLTYWSTVQKDNAVSGIKLDEFKHFIKFFTYHTYIQCLGQGNIKGTDVIQNVQDCIAILECGALQPHARPYMRLIELPSGVRCCRIKSRNLNDPRSAVVNYYQFLNTSIVPAIKILKIILHDPSFEEFRNLKRLDCHGYRLLTDPSDVFGYFVEGSSKSKNVEEIDEGIEKFRKSVNEILKELSEQEMNSAMEALLSAKKRTPNCLKEEVENNWAEIISETYVFDTLRREVDAISSLTAPDLKSLIISCTYSGPTLGKLSVQVVGNGSYAMSTALKAGQDDGNVLPTSQNTGMCPRKRGTGDYPLEYLTDSPNAEEKIDYYITDIEEYKRKLPVFTAHRTGL